MSFTSYPTSWGTPGPFVIGPDGNLWVIGVNSNTVHKFDVTTHLVTSYTVTGATSLYDICTDGTYLYICDNQPFSTAPIVAIYKITTSGVSSSFYDFASFTNAYNLYFDGSYIWLASGSSVGFRQIDLSGTLVNSYSGPANTGLGLLESGGYWVSGPGYSPNTGISQAPTSSPGSWVDLTLSGDNAIFASLGGYVWGTSQGGNSFFSLVPGASSVTAFSPTALASASTFWGCSDGSDLWVSTSLGVWITTPTSPTVGTLDTSVTGCLYIHYDSLSSAIWVLGNNYAATTSLAPPVTNAIVMIV